MSSWKLVFNHWKYLDKLTSLFSPLDNISRPDLFLLPFPVNSNAMDGWHGSPPATLRAWWWIQRTGWMNEDRQDARITNLSFWKHLRRHKQEENPYMVVNLMYWTKQQFTEHLIVHLISWCPRNIFSSLPKSMWTYSNSLQSLKNSHETLEWTIKKIIIISRSQLFYTKEKLQIPHCLEMFYKYIFMD